MIYFKKQTILVVLIMATMIVHAQKPNELLNLASRYESEGKLDEARGILESLCQSTPGNLVYVTRLKGLYLRMQVYDPLLKMLDDEIRKDPGNPGPIIEKAQAYHRMGKREEAIQMWKSIIQSHPKQKAVIQQVAAVIAAERLFVEALDVYIHGRKSLNEPNLWAIQMAGLYAAVNAYAEATREYLRYLDEKPNQAMYVETSILRMPKTRRAGDQILEVLKDAAQKKDSNEALLKILSRAHLRWGSLDDAYDFALRQESFSQRKQQGVALLEFADRLREPEMLPYAERAYREILNRYPDYPARDQILFLLGENFNVRKKWNKALVVLDSVAQQYPRSAKASEALLLYGQIQRDQKTDYAAADRALIRLLKDYPNTAEGKRAHLELGILQVMADSLEKAEQSFFRNLQLSQPFTPIWIEASLRLAETAYFRGQFDTALTVLKEMSQPGMKPGLYQHPAMNDGLRLRLLVQTHMRRDSDALRLLSESQLRIFQKRSEQAMKLLDDLIARFPKKEIIAYGLLERATIQKSKKSLADLDTLLSRFPESLIADQALYESGLVCEEMGDDASALRRYEQFLIEYPGSVHIGEVRKRIRQLEEEKT